MRRGHQEARCWGQFAAAVLPLLLLLLPLSTYVRAQAGETLGLSNQSQSPAGCSKSGERACADGCTGKQKGSDEYKEYMKRGYSCNNIHAGTGGGIDAQWSPVNPGGAYCHGDDVTQEWWNTKHLTGCNACSAYADYLDELCTNGTECFDGCFDGDNDSKGSKLLAAVGILLTVGGCFISNLGTNLQKVAMSANAKKPESEQKSVFLMPLWVTGMVCMICGSIADFVALGFAPQSLLAPLATFTLVFNVFMAQYLNKETPTPANIVATVIILAATFCIVYFGDTETKCYQLQELICRFTDTWMVVYMITSGTFMSVAFYKSRQADKEADLLSIPMTERRTAALWMAPFGGMCGGNTFLFAKAVAELIKAQFRGEKGIISPISLLLVAALAANLWMQVVFLNEALRRFDILLIVPVYQTFWILSGTMAGLIYFKEYVVIRRSTFHAIMFLLGVAGAISGVALLAKGTRDTETKRQSTLLSDEEREASGSDGEVQRLIRNTIGGRPTQRWVAARLAVCRRYR